MAVVFLLQQGVSPDEISRVQVDQPFIAIAACEAAVALAIVMSLYRILKDVSLDEASALKG